MEDLPFGQSQLLLLYGDDPLDGTQSFAHDQCPNSQLPKASTKRAKDGLAVR
jgi:hypothetical protein